LHARWLFRQSLNPTSVVMWLVRSAFVESRVQKLARFTSNPA
jgi:hypothetical protein